jgi:hypothetical protein
MFVERSRSKPGSIGTEFDTRDIRRMISKCGNVVVGLAGGIQSNIGTSDSQVRGRRIKLEPFDGFDAGRREGVEVFKSTKIPEFDHSLLITSGKVVTIFGERQSIDLADVTLEGGNILEGTNVENTNEGINCSYNIKKKGERRCENSARVQVREGGI